MSEPVNVFQQTRKHLKTGNLSSLATQVAAWQKLTQLVQPLLPQPEQWQVVCYQHGVLTLTGENQAFISQLAYLQQQYITQLSHLEEFRDLQKIQVRLRAPSQVFSPREPSPKTIHPETQEMLRCVAEYVNDPKLSQALLRLASNKK